jgi:hypothetical protein
VLEAKLKCKIRPYNAYFKAKGFEAFSEVPREELHQFLLGVMGDYIIPGTVYEYEKVLRHPSLVTSKPGAKIPTYVISNERLAAVWTRLRDRLASVNSSTSMVQITEDYAAHFYDMYINKHEGKHLTGDRIRILLLTLPFVLRDLIAPEVNLLYAMLYNMLHNIHKILHNMLHSVLHKLS